MVGVKSTFSKACLFFVSLMVMVAVSVTTALAEDGNVTFTCPSAVNFVIKADGTLIGPSNAKIESTGSAIHVEGVTTTQTAPYTFKDMISASDTNAVSLTFGSGTDTFGAESCLTGKSLSGDTWKIAANGNLGLSFEGRVAKLSGDVTNLTEFGKVVWDVALDGFTVTYDANGGSGSMSADVVDPGNPYTAKANGFTAPSSPTGLVFGGWNTAADGSGIAYSVDAPINVTANVTLYAQWFNPRAGAAYAVLDDAGTLTLFRSENTYTAGTGQTVTDIAGNSYTGQVYVNIENQPGTESNSARWSNQYFSIRKATIAPNQVISPTNCAGWFVTCSNLSDTSGLSSLDTSNVTSMYCMFMNCSNDAFTAPDVSEWDTSNVTNMNGMFANCSGAGFTAPDVSKWNTSKVTNMSYMFDNCSGDAFTAPDVSEWDISNATNLQCMFAICSGAGFTAPDVSKWNTSSVTNMGSMFSGCSGAAFTAPDVSKWNTSNVTNMNGMFEGCSGAGFTDPDVSKWNTSKVTNMSHMFENCSGAGFTSIDVSGWDISKVTSMYYMFRGCSTLETIYAAPDADWNASATLTAHSWMFSDCVKLKGGNGTTYSSSYIKKDRARVDGLGGQPGYFTAKYRNGNAYAVLDDAGTLTLFRSENMYNAGTGQTVTDVAGNSYTGQVYTNIENQTGTSSSSAPWYAQRSSIQKATIAPNQVISPTNCAGWFYGCLNLSDADGLSSLDTSQVTNMYYMFDGCKGTAFTAPDVSEWNTSNVTNMRYMFGNCSGAAFTAPDVSKWDISNVIDMRGMFSDCKGASFTAPDVSKWNTSKVMDMSYVFYYCSGDAFTAPDVSNWNTSSVMNMSALFMYCYGASFTAPDVSKWDTSKVTNMSSMFAVCHGAAFTAPDVSKWDTSSVTNMSSMFSDCNGAGFTSIDVSGWDISKVTNMGDMFRYCSNLVTIYAVPDADWNASSTLTSSSNMFQYCDKLKGSNGTKFSSSYINKARARVDGLDGQPGYFTLKPYTDGNAYAVLDSVGTLILFRSEDTYVAGTGQTVTDIAGNSYTGQVYTNIENQTGTSSNSAPWYGQSLSIEKVIIAPNQVISPTNCAGWFAYCSNLSDTSGLSLLDTSNVTSMSHMFVNCSGDGFTSIDVSGWDISQVTDMNSMFDGCSNLETIYAAFDTDWNASVMLTLSSSMFTGCTKLKGGSGTAFNSSYINKVRACVDGLNGQLGYFTVKPYTNGKAYAVLDSAGVLTFFRSENTYNDGAGQTVTDVVGNTYMGQVYTNIENQTGTSSNSAPWYNQRSSIQKVTIAPNQVISPTNCVGWFYGCSNLSDTSGLSSLDTSSVMSMSSMFYNCSNAAFTAPDMSKWNTSNVTSMGSMFSGCKGAAFTAPAVREWNTSKVTNMSYMFQSCNGVSFTAPDVSKWNTSSVTTMNWMFYNCYGDSFTAPDVSDWDTSKVTNMRYMFYHCSGAGFTAPDVSKWDTSSVTDMYGMFYYCSGTGFTSIDVSHWDTSKVTTTGFMFQNCSNLETIYAAPDADWNASVTLAGSSGMFTGCTKLVGGNGTTYNSSYIDKTRARVDGLGGQPGYFTAKRSAGTNSLHAPLTTMSALPKSTAPKSLMNALPSFDELDSENVPDKKDDIKDSEPLTEDGSETKSENSSQKRDKPSDTNANVSDNVADTTTSTTDTDTQTQQKIDEESMSVEGTPKTEPHALTDDLNALVDDGKAYEVTKGFARVYDVVRKDDAWHVSWAIVSADTLYDVLLQEHVIERPWNGSTELSWKDGDESKPITTVIHGSFDMTGDPRLVDVVVRLDTELGSDAVAKAIADAKLDVKTDLDTVWLGEPFTVKLEQAIEKETVTSTSAGEGMVSKPVVGSGGMEQRDDKASTGVSTSSDTKPSKPVDTSEEMLSIEASVLVSPRIVVTLAA